jgi:tetratricopeptide (TPR) repeat protein
VRQDLTPKGLARQAEKAFREGNYLEAVTGFKEAATAYQDQGQTLLAAEMWNNCGVALVQLGQGDEALKVIQPTLTLLESEGDLERLGIAYGNLASALEVCGRYEEAQQAYLRSAELLEKCGKAELRLHALKALSQLQLKQGKQLQALATFQAALEDAPRLSLQQKALKKLMEIPWKLLPK